MDRRRFLQAAGATSVGLSVGVGAGWSGFTSLLPVQSAGATVLDPISVATGLPYQPSPYFPEGVLSGDPHPDGVVLWTRPLPSLDGGAGVLVDYEVASDPGFAPASIVTTGQATALAANDHCVPIEVTGLEPGATYFYRFRADGHDSPIGRTKTAPVAGTDPGVTRFAFFSCQRWTHGYFPAHADLANRALDPATDLAFVVSLGDYVYNTGLADDYHVAGRDDPVQDAMTLADFRSKYHLYRTDVNLQALHANHTLIAIFDNHDGQGDPSDPAGPGAIGAFFEHMPVRRHPVDALRQYRSVQWGRLFELFMLDERQHRDPEPPSEDNPLGTSSVDHPEMFDPDRTMLGATQRSWLLESLSNTSAQWKILGSQLVFSPLRSLKLDDARRADPIGQRNAGVYVNLTAWDGYQGERQKILDHLAANGIDDSIAIAGDAHFWTASELQTDWDDPAAPYVITEFGGSSVTSANADEMGLPLTSATGPFVASANPQSSRFFETESHGVVVMELSTSRAVADFVATATTAAPSSEVSTLASFEVLAGTNRITPQQSTPQSSPTTASATTSTVVGSGAGGQRVAATPVTATPRFTG